MNPRLTVLSSIRRQLSGISLRHLVCQLVISLLFVSSLQAESGNFKTKTNGEAAEKAVTFPTPTASSGNPELLVIPLLGPLLELLPGAKLKVWVGHSDGTPLANTSVTLRVPEAGNTLADGMTRLTSITVQTQADGIAEVTLAAPEIPPATDGGGSPPPP